MFLFQHFIQNTMKYLTKNVMNRFASQAFCQQLSSTFFGGAYFLYIGDFKISMAFGAMIWAWISSCSATIHVFFCLFGCRIFCHSFLFFEENILLFFLTAPQTWCDQIWSNTCFWSNLITNDFSFPRKTSDFFQCFFLVGNKNTTLNFQELSMEFGWKLFWGVNALLWNLFVAKVLRPRIWDLHVKFSDLRIWF